MYKKAHLIVESKFTKRYDIYEYLCNQEHSNDLYKAKVLKMQRYRHKLMIGNFNMPFTVKDR